MTFNVQPGTQAVVALASGDQAGQADSTWGIYIEPSGMQLAFAALGTSNNSWLVFGNPASGSVTVRVPLTAAISSYYVVCGDAQGVQWPGPFNVVVKVPTSTTGPGPGQC
jgi:hypothetical protein